MLLGFYFLNFTVRISHFFEVKKIIPSYLISPTNKISNKNLIKNTYLFNFINILCGPYNLILINVCIYL